MQVDLELSEQLAEAIVKINLRQRPTDTTIETKACWRNAYRAAMYLAHLVGDALYAEDWAVALDTGLIFEHGWLEQADKIVDPTRWKDDLAYFPGLRFTLAEVEKVRIKTAGSDDAEFPLAHRIGGWSGLDNPEYRKAYEDALAFAKSRAVRVTDG